MFYITVILKWIFKSSLMCCLFAYYLKIVFGLLVIKQPQEHYNMLTSRFLILASETACSSLIFLKMAIVPIFEEAYCVSL